MNNKAADFKDFNDMAKAHRGVLKSLIDRDDKYAPKDVTEMNNAFRVQINYIRLKLEAYKMLREVPTRSELFLPIKEQ